ncbi:multiple sugar transport system substrate-binding protein [Lipingzhangella halophila]|uniref:Multiple sugar transport system substrate-binding protein n=1 Tax=Lipingzhangella halophila TaxID=1783352 RepID=A0A7W7W5W7_9ACTN|nr:extracellular solute-binding protein [Lipingzhangella halophila]MBB4935206.1 multiple sugar transport system substrate-binding protein [Lipingzhangella halophila]
MRRTADRVKALAVIVAAAVPVLASCSAPERDGSTITVWSLENLTERMAVTQEIADEFTAETGIRVELVAVEENDLSQMIMSAAAAGQLPDVIGAVPLGSVRQMASNDLLDSKTAGRVVDDLDPATFSERALDLTSDGGDQLAVPSDAWTQLLVYRTDLFEEAGLPAPTTYDHIEEAARTLHGSELNGISLATDPGDAFTQQSFEYLALANGCELVGESGEVSLDSPECRRAFSFYGDLTTDYAASGAQTVDSTRATYFSGRSAMIVWSSFLLDELAGLRQDALPSCPECADDPRWLAENSGVVNAMRGPDSDEPAQFGEVTSWAVTTTAHSGSARKFVTHMFDDGYPDWFGMAPEGKFPTRNGTPDDPERFQRAWENSEIGIDHREPLSEVFSEQTGEQLRQGAERMGRWGIPQGQGELVGATLGELPVPRAVNAQATGQIGAAEAARQANEDVAAIQNSLQ